jgi:hypothetical protein
MNKSHNIYAYNPNIGNAKIKNFLLLEQGGVYIRALNMTPDNEAGKRLDYGLGNLGIVIRIPKYAEIKKEWSYYSIPPYTFTPVKGHF